MYDTSVCVCMSVVVCVQLCCVCVCVCAKDTSAECNITTVMQLVSPVQMWLYSSKMTYERIRCPKELTHTSQMMINTVLCTLMGN